MSLSPWLLAGGFGLGLLVGSFVNLLVDRVPAHRPVLAGRSRCEGCGRALRPAELVPVLSFLWLRGRCRSCGAAIGWRTPAVELSVGLLFLAALALKGLTPEAARLTAYGSLLVAIFFIDLEHRIVPNRLVYPAAGLRLLDILILERAEWLNYLGGGLVGLLLFLVPILIYPAGMGMGDAKLGALIGLLLGVPRTLAALWLAFILGGLVAGLLLLTGRKGRKDAIPFAPYIVSAALIVALWQPASWTWLWP